MEMLSEHTLEGWMEGYVLTGRHVLFNTYEAFAHVVDSMVNQHAKWLEKSREISWRAPISSLNILISSTVWRQDHNGFTHQDPGFIDVVTNKSPTVTRIYLPPDANCLLSVADHCLRSHRLRQRHRRRQAAALQFLDMEAAVKHCTKGIGLWSWASNDQDGEPDVVIASAATWQRWKRSPRSRYCAKNSDLKIRFVNVVDLFKLQPNTDHPHGLSDRDFDSLFTLSKPVIFNFHGYPWLIHKLAYREPITTTCTCVATRKSAASILRCSSPSKTRPTDSIWQSTRSIGCRGSRRAAPTSRIGSRIRFARISTTRRPTGSTTEILNWKWPL